MNTSQAVESLQVSLKQGDELMNTRTWSGGGFRAQAVRRILSVQNSQTELFDAAQTILDWMRELPATDRPIAKFNRLEDALNTVREAHQMEVN